MNPEERNRLAEQWLETALKPRAPEPRPGLESRILAAIEAEKSVSRSPSPVPRFAFWVPRFAWPIAAGMVLASGLALYWSHRPQTRGVVARTTAGRTMPAPSSADGNSSGILAGLARNTPTVRSAQDGAPRSVAPTSAAEADIEGRVASAGLKPRPFERMAPQRSALIQRESPRLEQFPAPRPLSEQERLLLAYVRNTPREEVLLVVQRQAEDELKRQTQYGTDSTFPASSAAALGGTTEEN